MGWVALQRRELSGRLYEPGELVPDEVANEGAGTRVLVALGIVAPIPEAAAAGLRTGAESTVAAFDPGEHRIPDVLAYLDANPDQLDRVEAAERAGKERKGLLGEISERRASAEPDGDPEDEPPTED